MPKEKGKPRKEKKKPKAKKKKVKRAHNRSRRSHLLTTEDEQQLIGPVCIVR